MFYGAIEGTGFEVLDPRFNECLTGHGRVERLWTGARWAEAGAGAMASMANRLAPTRPAPTRRQGMPARPRSSMASDWVVVGIS